MAVPDLAALARRVFPVWLLAAVIVAAPAALAQSAAVPVVRISSENGPAHVQTRILQRFVNALKARAGDRLAVEFEHSGTLFRDRDVIAALQQDKVDMALPGTWQLDRDDPDIGALLLPMFYGRDVAAIIGLLDGAVGQTLSRSLENTLDLRVPGRWIPLGFAHLYTMDQPIRRQQDIAGLRLRSPGGEVNRRRLAALGATVIAVPWTEVPQAMRTGRIDGLLSTHATVVSARLWEYGLRYVYEDRQYFPLYVPLVSAHLWNRLSDDLRALFVETWEGQVEDARRATAVAQEDARRELLAHGMRIASPRAGEQAAWRRLLDAAQMEWAEEMGIDPDLVRLLRGDLGN